VNANVLNTILDEVPQRFVESFEERVIFRMAQRKRFEAPINRLHESEYADRVGLFDGTPTYSPSTMGHGQDEDVRIAPPVLLHVARPSPLLCRPAPPTRRFRPDI